MIDQLIALAAFLVAGAAVVWMATRRLGFAGVTWVAFLLHGLFAYLFYAEYGLWAPDATLYQANAVHLAANATGEVASAANLTVGKDGFPRLLSTIYVFLGEDARLGLIVNHVAMTLLVPIMGSAGRRLQGPGAGGAAAWSIALYPPLALWGGLLLREAITWLLLAIVLHAMIGLIRGWNVGDVLRMGGVLFALLWMRGTAAVIVGIGVFVGLVLAGRVKPRQAAAFGTFLLVGVFLVWERLFNILSVYDLTQVNASRTALMTDGRTGFEVLRYGGAGDALAALPELLVRVTLGSFPWEWQTMGAVFAADAVGWWTLLALAVIGFMAAEDKRRALALVVPAVALLVALALVSGNYGTMQRLRLQAVVLIWPLVGLGLSRLVRLRTRDASGSLSGDSKLVLEARPV